MLTKYIENMEISFLGKRATYKGRISPITKRPKGFGTAKLENNDTFEGFFYNGKPAYGTYTFENGSYAYASYTYPLLKKTYEVEYSHPGIKESISSITLKYDNGIYVGDFKHSLRDGVGKYIWNNGDSYNGGWKLGKKHGIGQYKYANGESKWFVFDNDKVTCEILENKENNYDSKIAVNKTNDEMKNLFYEAVEDFNTGNSNEAYKKFAYLNENGYNYNIISNDDEDEDIEELFRSIDK